jgi:hypothetical protein
MWLCRRTWGKRDLKTAERRDFPMEPIPLQDLLNIFRVKNTAAIDIEVRF